MEFNLIQQEERVGVIAIRYVPPGSRTRGCQLRLVPEMVFGSSRGLVYSIKSARILTTNTSTNYDQATTEEIAPSLQE